MFPDVPERLINGELVPMSEIIAHWGEFSQVLVVLILEQAIACTAMAKKVVDGNMNYRITTEGLNVLNQLFDEMICEGE